MTDVSQTQGHGTPQVMVGIDVDPKKLAALRLLLSQVGFAIDNYLLAVTRADGDDD